MLSTIVLIALVSGAIYYILNERRSRQTLHDLAVRQGCKPPLHLPSPWLRPFGLDKLDVVIEAEKRRRYPLMMLEEHEKHGETYSQYSGLQYAIITRDTENIREILARQFKNFDTGTARAGCLRPLLGNNIFTQDGIAWDHSRKLLAPLIKRPDLSPFELFEKHFQNLRSLMVSSNANNAHGDEIKLDLKPLLFDLAFSLTTEFLLGPAASTSSTEGQAFADAFNTAFKWIAKRERLKSAYWLIDSLEFRRSCNDARSRVDNIIKRTSKLIEDSSGMESRIALFRLLHDDSETSEIRDQFLGFLLAGRDTSGALMSWCLYVLAREPRIFEDLRAEIGKVVGGRQPAKEDFRKLKLLDQFLNEVLRIFPPVPINGRFCNKTTTLPRGGGPDGNCPIVVPAGSIVAFSAYAVHTNKDLWGKDASRFDLEKWSEPRTLADRITDWSYFPFLAGPRKCIGEQFAIDEAKYMICRFLQQFPSITAIQPDGTDVALKNGDWIEDVKYHVGLTMSPDDGVWVKLASSH